MSLRHLPKKQMRMATPWKISGLQATALELQLKLQSFRNDFKRRELTPRDFKLPPSIRNTSLYSILLFHKLLGLAKVGPPGPVPKPTLSETTIHIEARISVFYRLFLRIEPQGEKWELISLFKISLRF